MKKITYVIGQYSQIKLEDGSRAFIEILPERVRAKKMVLGVIPTKTIWEFIFPFYIRTATGTNMDTLNATWTIINSGDLISRATKEYYIQWKTLFNNTTNQILHAVAINWLEGKIAC